MSWQNVRAFGVCVEPYRIHAQCTEFEVCLMTRFQNSVQFAPLPAFWEGVISHFSCMDVYGRMMNSETMRHSILAPQMHRTQTSLTKEVDQLLVLSEIIRDHHKERQYVMGYTYGGRFWSISSLCAWCASLADPARNTESFCQEFISLGCVKQSLPPT